jgi:hypothetical protein
MRAKKEDDHWILPVAGCRVIRCGVDPNVFIEGGVSAGESFTLIIEGEFSLLRHGAGFELDPADRGALGPLLELWNREFRQMVIDKSGQVAVSFDDDSRLIVSPASAVEAWEFHAAGGYLIICLPGGGSTLSGANNRGDG